MAVWRNLLMLPSTFLRRHRERRLAVADGHECYICGDWKPAGDRLCDECRLVERTAP